MVQQTSSSAVAQYVEKLRPLRNSMSSEQWDAMSIRLAERQESFLRSRNPEHPLLKKLDAHRRNAMK